MNRVLVKLSGEALNTELASLPNASDFAYVLNDPDLNNISGFGLAKDAMLLKIASDLKEAQQTNVQIALVVGGGNICRGAQGRVPAQYRPDADKIGMLATIVNGLLLNIALNSIGAPSVVLSTRSMPATCELYTPNRAAQYLEAGKIVICAGGSGQPFFTTDTAAVIRAGELGCDALFKATKVSGVYEKDPVSNPDTPFIPALTYDVFLKKHIKIMDATAVSIAKDLNLPIHIFSVYEPRPILRAVNGKIKKSIIA